MPVTLAADGTEIAYQVVGPAGAPPLLLIQGLGADRRGWVLQQAALGRRFRCISFDNRGAGRSGKPPGPYHLEVMAQDAVAVLDAAGIPGPAHVMGASMGGVIAQIMAVRHPERVRSLVLACTGCHHLPWRRQLLEDWARTAQEQGMRVLTNRALRWLVGPRARRRLYLPAQLLGSVLLNVPAHAFVSQVQAILDMPDDVRFELAAITAPTLVLVGSQDILTPVGDAEELVEHIPGARMEVLWGAAHALMAEQAGTYNRLVADFLDEVEASRPDRAFEARSIAG
jgi:3-oxoadipate enol-lactonase